MPFTESADGTRLYYEVNSATTPKINALLIHGFGEHCRRYDVFSEHLNELGVSTLRFDLRGHGRSDGRRGHILSFNEYLDDVRAALKIFQQEVEMQGDGKVQTDQDESLQLPRLLMGHSNGGLIATHALIEIEDLRSWDAFVLSSPFFAIKVKVPAWKSFLGSKLSRFMPSIQLPTDLPPEVMSHDPELIAAYGNDPLIGRVASARWLTETLRAHSEAPEKLRQIKGLRSLWQVAGDDHVADAEVSQTFFNELATEDKTLKVYPKCYHEIWFEVASLRAPVIKDLEEFIHQLISNADFLSSGVS